MNRKEKRKNKKKINMFSSVFNIINNYFSDLINKFKNLTDVRNQAYVKYSMDTIMLTRLMACISGIQSMRSLTDTFNTEETIQNISSILNINLDEIPHYDTINDVFKNIKLDEIRAIQKYMVNSLIRSKTLDKFRFNDKYFQIVIDATGLHSFKECPYEGALCKTYNKGTEDEYSLYFTNVLEAKLIAGDIAISIDTEFIENEQIDSSKQDCELNAFKRMAKRIKSNFPKLPIIISGDSLYACEPVKNICKENKWEYIIRFKPDSIPTLGEQITKLEELDNKSPKKEKESNENDIFYTNEITYGEAKDNRTTNIIKYYDKEDNSSIEFMWITSIEITNNNMNEIIKFGKQRWNIENYGFNEQKNGPYNVSHMFSKNINAYKVHYFIIQFAHTIRQLLENGITLIVILKLTKEEVSSTIIKELTSTIQTINPKQIQLRLTVT